MTEKHSPPLKGTKVCKKCELKKPVLFFAADSGMADGLKSICRMCEAAARHTGARSRFQPPGYEDL